MNEWANNAAREIPYRKHTFDEHDNLDPPVQLAATASSRADVPSVWASVQAWDVLCGAGCEREIGCANEETSWS